MNPLGEAHICCLHTVVSHLYVTNTRFVEDPLTEGRQSTESHGLSYCKKSQANGRISLCSAQKGQKTVAG